jgi:hypothetical protein
MAGASLAPSQPVTAGSTIPVQVSSDIYYRRILTGYAVAELRASTSISPGMLQMNPNANRLQMANDMDRLLATSVSMGREARAFTGWDHLIQHMDFAFTASVPGTVTTASGPVPRRGCSSSATSARVSRSNCRPAATPVIVTRTRRPRTRSSRSACRSR